MLRIFQDEFKNPGSPYRGVILWMWSGKPDENELRRQIRLMKEMGFGGFFIFSFTGLKTRYLSEEWFACIGACCEEAEKLDMKTWLYDEDRYPSGAAGGLATRDARFRARSLIMEKLSNPGKFKWRKNTIAVFAGKVKGTSVSNIRRIRKGEQIQLSDEESLLAFSVKVQKNSPEFNGYTYLDTLNPAAVRNFIKVTHEAYKKRFKDRLGRSIPGFFTDEPYQSSSMFPEDWARTGMASAPWTDKLPLVFRRRYGYDIINHLPELFLDINNQLFTQPRYHYHDCVTHLFADSFGRQIGQWCEKNNLILTGHLQKEDLLSTQTEWLGSCMRLYEHMQAPGLDLLTQHMRIFTVAKQVNSAARQFGRKWRFTETYGCTGWDFPFVGHKALGDWQAALGINLRGVHLTWYSMLGQRKRECPASFLQSPWKQFYKHVEEYFGRVNVTLTQGEEVRDLLVILPLESVWLLSRADWQLNRQMTEQDRAFWHLCDTLLANHLDFDYGDEDILARHGSIGKKQGVPVLQVGKATYCSVLVPPMLTMRRTTLALLRKFREAGGDVVFAGDAPAYLDAVPSTMVREFADQCRKSPADGPGMVSVVEKYSRRISIVGADGKELKPVLYLLREDEEAFYLFICNTGRDFTMPGPPVSHYGPKPDLARAGTVESKVAPEPAEDEKWKGYGGGHGQREVECRHDSDSADFVLETAACEQDLAFSEVHINGIPGWQYAPLELCPETGEMIAADTLRTADGYQINTCLPRLGSRLFLIPKKPLSIKPAQRVHLKEISRSFIDEQVWEIGLSEPNVLVLDRPQLKIAGGEWQPENEVLKADKAIRAHLGLPCRSQAMFQPWARTKKANPGSVQISLRYVFDVEVVPRGQILLGLEEPQLYRIYFNGTFVSPNTECGWWVDPSLRTIPLDSALIRPGKNEILLECAYDENHPGLEALFLLGDFGAKVEGTRVSMVKPVCSLRLGDWVEQGLPFYAGSVRYLKRIQPCIKEGERLFVHIPDYRGTAIRVLVDGKEAGFRAWEPYEVDITDFVSGQEEVTLAIEVIGHRRNSHGPLHAGGKFLVYIGPAQFEGYEGEVEEYQLVPCGLMAAPQLVVRSPVVDNNSEMAMPHR